jgi:hypothetical protein
MLSRSSLQVKVAADVGGHLVLRSREMSRSSVDAGSVSSGCGRRCIAVLYEAWSGILSFRFAIWVGNLLDKRFVHLRFEFQKYILSATAINRIRVHSAHNYASISFIGAPAEKRNCRTRLRVFGLGNCHGPQGLTWLGARRSGSIGAAQGAAVGTAGVAARCAVVNVHGRFPRFVATSARLSNNCYENRLGCISGFE